ncbi:MAG: DAK2 domain-containing protein [Anaerolineae bacterium]|nr:DAK2 domain-containing protein [Anaerolineae bacterium]
MTEVKPQSKSSEASQIPDTLDGQGLKRIIAASMTWLKTNQQTVNSLNVFPVPDGDTGTNMLLTMQAAYNEIANSDETNIGIIAHAIAKGALLGARGNSGVILSQLFRGFARTLDNLETMDAALMVKSFHEARNTGYKGVVRPVEGTILTVAKDVAQAAHTSLQRTTNMKTILEDVVVAADDSVKRTPDLLPILKQAGVVDSGGKGLFFILEGVLRYINGEQLETPTSIVKPIAKLDLEQTLETIEPGQDYEVVIDFVPSNDFNLERFYEGLTHIGTSIQVGEGDGMYRIHIHVPLENRYEPIGFTEKLGTINKIFMENLVAQMEDQQAGQNALQLTPVEPEKIAVVVVSPGQGLSAIFASLGAAAIVEGGQTMNPSTQEIIHAFEDLPTDKIIILPNNKNIILSAQAAVSMTVKKVAVVPSTNVPQGLCAMLRLNPDGDFDKIVQEMNASMSDVDTGEVTIATRSVEINGIKVKKGAVIALHNGTLVYSSDNLEDACLGLLKKANATSKERITLFYGDNIPIDQVNQIFEAIKKAYPSHELELHAGGQPHYQFIIAIE